MAAGTTGGSIYSGYQTPTLEDWKQLEDPIDEELSDIESSLEGEEVDADEDSEEVLPSSLKRTDNKESQYGIYKLAFEDIERSWQDQANCLGVDPELFFPERGASTREAKEVCKGCAVREACLEYALTTGEKFGIWGGLSERERRRIRRQRSLARRALIDTNVE